MKQLNKVGKDYVTKTGKKISTPNFDLSSKLFTSDILVATLKEYSSTDEDIYNITQETGLTASEVIEKYRIKLDKFGIKALKASQEARTFNEVIGAVKDAVSTGWMNTA